MTSVQVGLGGLIYPTSGLCDLIPNGLLNTATMMVETEPVKTTEVGCEQICA